MFLSRRVIAASGGGGGWPAAPCVLFDGASGYADTGYTANHTAALTLEAMVQIAAYPAAGEFYFLLDKTAYYAPTRDDFPVRMEILDTGALVLNLSKGGDFVSDLQLTTPDPVPLNAPLRLSAVYRANGLCELLIDGVVRASSTINFTISSNARSWALGRASHEESAGTGATYAACRMADARIWTQARSVADIEATKFSRLAGDETGLLMYYRMDEASGTTLIDSAATTNASLTGGATWSTM